ncbi:hypothetical protein [Streptomyces sp. NPDC005435]|uniref:hypothetical protein n=1 Tax=Streptomyces sp. NPDC005435 TaxID=3154464 RepID=UPI0034565593
MVRLAVLAAWAVTLVAVNRLLADEWAEYAFTFVSAVFVTLLMSKAGRTRQGK